MVILFGQKYNFSNHPGQKGKLYLQDTGVASINVVLVRCHELELGTRKVLWTHSLLHTSCLSFLCTSTNNFLNFADRLYLFAKYIIEMGHPLCQKVSIRYRIMGCFQSIFHISGREYLIITVWFVCSPLFSY